MTKDIISRLRKLERAPRYAPLPARRRHVIEGGTDGERRARIDAMLAAGLAAPHDIFRTIVGPNEPRVMQ